ncbi:hypothetical protein D3C78_1376790 [compost metagenome]
MQWIQGDGQNHCPEHQVEEGVEDLEAEQYQHRNQPGANQYIEQTTGQCSSGNISAQHCRTPCCVTQVSQAVEVQLFPTK